MDEGKMLELLEFLQNTIEMQGSIITNMSRLIKQQAEALANYRQVTSAENELWLTIDEAMKKYKDQMESW